MTDFRAHPPHRFDRVANFRDLAGHRTRDGRRIRPGRLLRSGHLGRASDTDVAILASFGLRRVFDFRNPSDIRLEGEDRLPHGTESIRLPMPDPARGQDIREMMTDASEQQIAERFGEGRAEAMMRESAASLVRERREPYRQFLKALAEPASIPALFHCSAGKDRAGWAGSVVLLTLGVPEEEIIEQYLLSNRAAQEIIDQVAQTGGGAIHDAIRPLIGVQEDYIRASLQAVHEDWGDFDRYLHDGLGVSEAERAGILENLLD